MEIVNEVLDEIRELIRQYRIYFKMRKYPLVHSKKYWEN